jgi:NADP-dependent 3-hydroxy acid dehydrogenase YdfG
LASTGTATVRGFAEGGYRVAMLARDADRLVALEREIGAPRLRCGWDCRVLDRLD